MNLSRALTSASFMLLLGHSVATAQVFAEHYLGDFTGDGKTDLVVPWINDSYFLIPDMRFSDIVEQPLYGVWKLRGAGDFNGDGAQDLLLRNTSDGSYGINTMRGGTIRGSVIYANIPLAWKIAGIGDFDGDRTSDVLWWHDNGTYAVHLIDGALITRAAAVTAVPTYKWAVRGVADFDGDGKADILWQHKPSQELYLHYMNGLKIKGTGHIAGGLAWTVHTVGDFDGDGSPDLLYANRGRDFASFSKFMVALVEDGAISDAVGFYGEPDVYSLGVGDLNGDGKEDLMFHSLKRWSFIPINGAVKPPYPKGFGFK